MREKIRQQLPIFVLGILSFTPVIWFLRKPGFLINGTDTNFPLEPITFFLQRLHIFYTGVNEGIDWPSATTGIFFHGIQVLVYVLTKSLILTQLITSLFWFGMILFSMYYFLRVLIGNKYPVSALLGAVLYGFNLYMFNSWENIKVSNLAVVAVLPLILGLLYETFKKPDKKYKYLVKLFVVSIAAVGSGINPAYFLIILFAICAFGLFMILTSQNRRRLFITLVQFLFVFLGINAFWLLPLIISAVGLTGNALNKLTDVSDLDWLGGLSNITSILSVMRLQGAWDWYSAGQDNIPYVPFAQVYFTNAFFVVTSLLIPALAIFGFIANLGRKYIFFFLFLYLLGIILSTGVHMPFGMFYMWMVNKIPFFSFFRSPWYIFTPLTLVGMSVLVAHFGLKIEKKFDNKVNLPLLSLLIVINLIYTYPLITGDIFRPNKKQGQSLYVKIPQYALDARDELSTIPATRFLSLPFNQVENFRWGYGGVGSILNLLSEKQVVVRRFGIKQKSMVELAGEGIEHAIAEGKSTRISGLASIAGIDGFFVKDDLAEDMKDVPNISLLESNFASSAKHFDQWHYYFYSPLKPKIFSASSAFLILGDKENIKELFDLIPLIEGSTLYFDKIPDVLNRPGNNSIVILANCFDCLAESVNQGVTLPEVYILPSSPLYSQTEEKEAAYAMSLGDTAAIIDYYAESSLRQAMEIDRMVFQKEDSESITRSLERVSRTWNSIMEYSGSFKQNQPEKTMEYYVQLMKLKKYIQRELEILESLVQSIQNRRVTLFTLSSLQQIDQQIKTNIWSSTVTEKRLLFTLSQPGSYKMFLNKDPILDIFKTYIHQNLNVTIDGKPVVLSNSTHTDWLSGDLGPLDTGSYKLEISLSPALNLVSGSEVPLDFPVSTIGQVVEKTLPIQPLIPNRQYKISFYFRTIQGIEPYLQIRQNTDKVNEDGKIERVIDMRLPRDSLWRLHEETFAMAEPVQKADVVFIASPLGKYDSSYEIKNLKIELLYKPDVIIWNEVLPSSDHNQPQIQVLSSSPTKYKVRVSNAKEPFPLVMLYKYSPAWKVRIDSSLIPITEENHFLVNDFANGWTISKTGDYTVTIEYWPQYLFYIGGVFGLLLAGYLFYKSRM